jgi:hypothetical protein
MTPKTAAILFILFSVCGQTHTCFSTHAYTTNRLSLCYGTTNRFDKTYRHSISIDNWILKGACTQSKYKGYGASVEWTDKTNYHVGIRYYKSLQRHPSSSGVKCYLGAAPTVFFIHHHWGFNVAPEIGAHIPYIDKAFGFSATLCYGYDIPIINEKDYSNNRHRLTLKVGFDLDPKQLKKLVTKKTKSDPDN